MTEVQPAARVVESAAEIIRDVGIDITGITFYALSAEIDESDDAPESMRSELTPVYGLKIHAEGDMLGVRLSTELDLGVGSMRVDAAVNYIAKESIILSEAVRLDFANKVGVMALLPYVRQAIADLGQRVFGEMVLMPIIPLGGLEFTSDDAQQGV